MKSNFLLILVFSLAIAGCIRKEEKKPVNEIFLTFESQVPFTDSVTVSSLQPEGKKEFTFFTIDSANIINKKFSASTRKLLVVTTPNSFKIPLSVAPGDSVNITFHNSSFSDYELSGSAESAHLRDHQKTFVRSQTQMDSIMEALYKSTEEGTYGEVRKKAKHFHNQVLKQLKSKAKDLVNKNPGYLANILILNRYLGNQRILSPQENIELFHKADSMIIEHHGSNPLAQQFHRQVNRLIKELKEKEKRASQVAKGKQAPEISATTPDGNEVSIKNFKNKPLLLVFWSVKDESSVKKLNRLKKIYREYHPDGFEIFALSVDNDQQLWEKVATDTIYPWPNANAAGWLSAPQAKLFAVDSLPATFLIDGKDRIIGKNLNITKLSAKLDSLTTR